MPSRILASLLATLVVVLGAGGPATAADPGVCTGVVGCRVMAYADINGDGRTDSVGMVRRGANGAPNGTVTVRVKARPGVIASAVTPTQYWYGSPWQGIARIDGRPGQEIVVGRTMGAHTQYFRALTWRGGRLVTLDAPGPAVYWVIDGAVSISMGWLRKTTDPIGTVRRRVAQRTGDPVTSPFRGTVTTYRWTNSGWVIVRVERFTRLTNAAAYSWGGFALGALQRW